VPFIVVDGVVVDVLGVVVEVDGVDELLGVDDVELDGVDDVVSSCDAYTDDTTADSVTKTRTIAINSILNCIFFISPPDYSQ
jgi:hypothetical protein